MFKKIGREKIQTGYSVEKTIQNKDKNYRIIAF